MNAVSLRRRGRGGRSRGGEDGEKRKKRKEVERGGMSMIQGGREGGREGKKESRAGREASGVERSRKH